MKPSEVPWFVVWCPEHGPPVVRHATRAQATREALRLARLHRGRAFHVLALVDRVQAQDVVHERFEMEMEIPF